MSSIPITRPLLGDEEAEAAAEVVRSGWLTSGPRVGEFEEKLAAQLGARAAICVSNGTTAIELGLRVVGVGPGDVVATVSHSFIATANAIRACGAEPLFVDIDAETRNMCPDKLEAFLEAEFDDSTPPRYREVAALANPPSPLATVDRPSGRLGAILVVHQVGMPAPLDSICAIAARFGVPVVEDGACALGSQFEVAGALEMVGRPRGAVCTFSFHPRKVITTGEGGALTVNDEALARRARLLRNHGLTVGEGSKRHYGIVGFNLRMSDVAAAIGCVQLDRLDDIVASRRRLAGRYDNALDGLEGVRRPVEPAWARTNFQSYIAELEDGVSQSAVISGLGKRGIAAQPGIMCAHLEPPYERPGRWSLPDSERATARGLTLPLFPQMSDDESDRVLAALAEALAEARSG